MKRSRRDSEFADDDFARPKRRRRGGRWKRRLFLFLVFVAIMVAALPWLVAKTPLGNLLIAAAMPNDAVRVTIGDASLGWLSEPSLSQVDVRDADGRPLLAIELIQMRRTPWALALNWRNLGEIEITKPTLYLDVRANGSNVEDAIARLTAGSDHVVIDQTADEQAAAPIELAVRVVDGAILANDVAASRQWRARGLELQFDSRDARGGVGRFAASGQLETKDAGGTVVPAGQFVASLVAAEGGRQQLQAQAESLSLAVLRPWLQRFATGVDLNGNLTGQGTATWDAGAISPSDPPVIGQSIPAEFATSGVLRIDQLDAAAAVLSGDRIRLSRVELPWQVSAQPQGIVIEQLQIKTDVGQIAARGTIDPNGITAAANVSPNTLGMTGLGDVEVRGELDLARLAAMLPRALRIRDDTTITGGTIQLIARSQSLDGEQSLSGVVRTAGLAANSAGRPVRWDQPASATFDLRREAGRMRIESLRCDSEFLRIEAAGTTQQLTASAEFDLNRLASQLGQFVDLNGIELAGTGTAHVDWHQTAADKFAAAANSELSQLRLTLGDGTVWAEPRLALKAAATGALDPATLKPTSVANASFQIVAETDELAANLTGPVALTAAAPTWPVSVLANGSLARWLVRARPWFDPGSWQMDGQSELAVDANVSATAVDVAAAKLIVLNLRAVGGGLSINEPKLEVAGDGRWNGATSEVGSKSLQIVTSTVAVAAQDLRARIGGEGAPQLSGAAAFRADLARLAAWQVATNSAPGYRPQGMLTGNLQFAQQADRTTGELSANGQNLSLVASRGVPAPGSERGGGPPGSPTSDYQTIWQEPQLSVRGVVAYEASVDRMTLQQFEVQSNTLQATIGGKIEKLTAAADVNLTGTANYDLAQLTPLLRPYLGDGIQFTGREAARFQVAGAIGKNSDVRFQNVGFASQSAVHWSRQVRARFEAPWASANVYGLPVGGGKIGAELVDGAVRFDPLAIAVAEGQLTATPLVRLDPEPMELTLPQGPVLSNVNISPEVSEAMLKYVAPVLAGATQSEGKFSLQLEGARVPFGDPKRADVAGKLAVHSVRVVPGPLAKEWIGIAQQIEAIAKRRDPAALAQRPTMTLLSIHDQQVNFRLVDGRVHHQNMEFQIDDVRLRSEGSVGLDETLSLVLHVPIQDKWIEGERLLAGLKGQSLTIPVGGTLTRPRMDQSAVAGLSQQLLQGAAQQAVGNELNRALDKLFKPR